MARNVGRPAVGRAPPMSFFSPQRGHRRQEEASLYPSSASAWAQMIGASSVVSLNQGTGRYTQDLMIAPRVMKATGA